MPVEVKVYHKNLQHLAYKSWTLSLGCVFRFLAGPCLFTKSFSYCENHIFIPPLLQRTNHVDDSLPTATVIDLKPYNLVSWK